MNFLGGCGDFGYSYFHLIYIHMISLNENVIERAPANLLYLRPQIPKWQGEGIPGGAFGPADVPLLMGFLISL